MRLLTYLLLFLATAVSGQSVSSGAVVHKVYSENEQFYLKSIPYDNNDYTILGKTYVYEVGQDEPLYTLDRSFNYFGYPNKTNLSNDGQTIFHINDIYGNDEVDQLNPVTVYTRGRLVKNYSLNDLSDCDNDRQDCYLLYRNPEVINRDSSKWFHDQIIIDINEDASEIEKFANTYNIFSSGDTVYLFNQFRQLYFFDLTTGALINSSNPEPAYARIKGLARTNKVEIEYYEIPPRFNLPPLTNGQSFSDALSTHLNMVAMKFYGEEFNSYKGYLMDVEVIIDAEGEIQIKNLELEDGLPEKKVRDFLFNQSWDMNDLPPPLEKWYFEERLLLRKASPTLAKVEKEVERLNRKEAYIKKLQQDSINGFYIPKDLYECMLQLDSILKTKDRESIRSSGGRTTLFHHSLGRYLRNNWGLWSGSRLKKYFTDRAELHPDDMSGIIIKYYYDWLTGKTNTWKQWELEYPIINK